MKEEFTIGGITFKDVTSYSRSDKERKPTMFEGTVGKLKICITNNHRYYPNEFVFHCYGLGFDTYHIKDVVTHNEAAVRAMQICKGYLTQALAHFPINLP